LIVTRSSVRTIARAPTRRSHDNSVDLKRVPPKSRPPLLVRRHQSAIGKRRARTPPSTFLFLPIHLSNSEGPWRPRLPVNREAVEASSLRPRSEALSPSSVRSFEGAQSRRKADGAPYGSLYSRGCCRESTPKPNYSRIPQCSSRRNSQCSGRKNMVAVKPICNASARCTNELAGGSLPQ
jgi:hypothetical protein